MWDHGGTSLTCLLRKLPSVFWTCVLEPLFSLHLHLQLEFSHQMWYPHSMCLCVNGDHYTNKLSDFSLGQVIQTKPWHELNIYVMIKNKNYTLYILISKTILQKRTLIDFNLKKPHTSLAESRRNLDKDTKCLQNLSSGQWHLGKDFSASWIINAFFFIDAFPMINLKHECC